MPDDELIAHIAATTGLEPGAAARVVSDVVAWYREPVEEYVRRRHTQLQTYGARNAEVFPQIAAELRHRVVAPPSLSERQLRRVIYG